MTFGSPQLLTLLLVWLWLAACAEVPKGYSARGTIGGQTIDTRLDSKVAQYYLTNYLAEKRTERTFDQRIDRVYHNTQGTLPTRDELKRLSQEFSLDFAALYLADQISRDPDNRRFRGLYEKARSYSAQALHDDGITIPAEVTTYEVLFVPGYLYREHSYTGADFTVARSALDDVDFEHHFVETDEDAAIEENAPLVAAAIRARRNSGRRLIVVSASKSGPEVALALTQLGQRQTSHVGAWMNIVGTLQGSYLADEGIQQRHEALFGEIDPVGVESLTTEHSRKRFATFHVPEHILIVNYLGIPLTGTISSWAKEEFIQLQKYGPNDGLSLLTDLIMPGGVTLAEMGRDHFLLGDGLDVTTVALAMTMIQWLQEPPRKELYETEKNPPDGC